MSNKMMGAVRTWAATAQQTAVWMVFVLSVTLTLCGIVIFAYDVIASYDGWGSMVDTHTRTSIAPEFLGGVLAVLPTLVQIVFFTSLVAGLELLSNSPVFRAMAFFMFGLDSVLDYVALYDPALGFASGVFSIAVVFFVFGILSEILVSFFGPVAVALGESLFGKMQFGFSTQTQPRQQNNQRRQGSGK